MSNNQRVFKATQSDVKRILHLCSLHKFRSPSFFNTVFSFNYTISLMAHPIPIGDKRNELIHLQNKPIIYLFYL
jgi:hypothetical protein